MKSLCFILILFLPFLFYGCYSIGLDSDNSTSNYGPKIYSHYVECRGVVSEKATKAPMSGITVRITKEISVPPYIDSVCETTTNEYGEYFMRFWYDKEFEGYELAVISDSTILPNPDYIPSSGWYGPTGESFNTWDKYPLDIKSVYSVTVSPVIPSYAYVTLRLKLKEGFEEPIKYTLFLNGDTVKQFMNFGFPVANSGAFGRMLIFNGNEPQKVEIHLVRTIQSNKRLTKTITPVPTKLIVEEFEF